MVTAVTKTNAARLAIVATVALGLAIAFAQPWNSPWWTYADADGAYVGSSLNLLDGYATRNLDHPGLPVQELDEVAFGAEWIAKAVTGSAKSRTAFVDRQLLNLDRARPVYRGVAIALYLLGVLLAFVLTARTFGHWAWGLAGALLWLAAPALSENSIQVRPDVALGGSLLVFAYFVGRAVQTRAPVYFLAAGATLGFATMVKLHAAGAVVSLVLAAIARPPAAGWRDELRTQLRAFARRRSVIVAVVLLTILALVLNINRFPWHLTQNETVAGLIAAAVGIAGWYAARVMRAFGGIGLSVVGVVAGLGLPILFDVPDGLQALVSIHTGLTGGGVDNVPLFSSPVHLLDDLRRPFFLYLIAGVAALVGLLERELRPAIWFAGATVLGVMAQARVAEPRYFSAPYALALFAALWLFRRRPGIGLAAVWIVVAYLVVPVWQQRHNASYDAAQAEAVFAPAKAWLASHQKPDEAALISTYYPFADSRYYELVQQYVVYTPPYPYHDITDSVNGARIVTDRGLKLRYYVGAPVASLTQQGPLHIAAGDFVAKPVAPFIAELVSGGGVDRLFSHPDATYDPWTGYFKDPQGRYWKSDGSETFNPPRRRYLAKQHVWVDAYGDLWSATGKHVGNRPDLRQTP